MSKEHPILFSGPLVRAILDGRKTQTRRLLRWDGVQRVEPCPVGPAGNWSLTSYGGSLRVVRCPYGQPGDRLWVRETWAALGNEDGLPVNDKDEVIEWGPGVACIYRADTVPGKYGADVLPNGDQWFEKWRPSIHMPRWASRISLENVEVRVQRIQDISDADIQAEGILEEPLNDPRPGAYRGQFQVAWEQVYPGSWAANAWVWAISFRQVQG